MMNIKHIVLWSMAAFALAGCRVDTNTESVPEAEGSGKKAINIRVEPMSRDEIKSAASDAIDRGAEAATQIRNAATTAVENLQTVGKAVTTFSDTMVNVQRPGEQSATVTTTTQVTTTTD
jgi:hypothetical protein